jgi:hypothetical protein
LLCGGGSWRLRLFQNPASTFLMHTTYIETAHHKKPPQPEEVSLNKGESRGVSQWPSQR